MQTIRKLCLLCRTFVIQSINTRYTSIIEYFDNKDGKYHITILEKIKLFVLLLFSLIVI